MANQTIRVNFDPDDLKLFNSFRKIVDQQKKMEQGFGKVGNAAKRAGRQNKSAFGPQAIKGLAGMAAGYLSIQNAVNLVTESIGRMQAANEQAAQSMKQSEAGFSKLTQLAGGDSKRLNELIKASKVLFRQGGANSLNEAAETIFSLESAGALDQRKLFANLFGVVEDVGTAAKASTTLLTAFGADEAGTIKEILAKGFAASKAAPATAEEILEASGKGAAFATRLGFSDEQTLAATAVAAKGIGNAAEGGTTVASLFKSLATNEIGTMVDISSGNIADVVRQIDALGLSSGELKKAFGRAEGIRAFDAISKNMGLFEKTVANVSAATEGDLQRMIDSAQSQVDIQVARKARQQAAQRELSESRQAVERLNADRVIDRAVGNLRASGDNFKAAAMETAIAAQRRLGVSDAFIVGQIGTATERAEFDEFSEAASGSGIIDRDRLRQRQRREMVADGDLSFFGRDYRIEREQEQWRALNEATRNMRAMSEQDNPTLGVAANEDR